jgi:hypothetical protein
MVGFVKLIWTYMMKTYAETLWQCARLLLGSLLLLAIPAAMASGYRSRLGRQLFAADLDFGLSNQAA